MGYPIRAFAVAVVVLLAGCASGNKVPMAAEAPTGAPVVVQSYAAGSLREALTLIARD